MTQKIAHDPRVAVTYHSATGTGNPYGTGHVTGGGPMGEVSLEAARMLGRWVARFARVVSTIGPVRAA